MKYRKKPVVVEAIQIKHNNVDKVKQFCPEIKVVDTKLSTSDIYFTIRTLEGIHITTVGDYIIRGVAGEYYPCKPDIFEKTYEPVEE